MRTDRSPSCPACVLYIFFFCFYVIEEDHSRTIRNQGRLRRSTDPDRNSRKLLSNRLSRPESLVEINRSSGPAHSGCNTNRFFFFCAINFVHRCRGTEKKYTKILRLGKTSFPTRVDFWRRRRFARAARNGLSVAFAHSHLYLGEESTACEGKEGPAESRATLLTVPARAGLVRRRRRRSIKADYK